MTVSLYVSIKDIPDEETEAFIQDLKDFLAAKWAGKNIKIVFNYY